MINFSGFMISKKQLQANISNAKLGGVKTEEGKLVSCHNAVKHGLLSDEIPIENEDQKEFLELRESLFLDLSPVGALEVILVDKIVANVWRLRRSFWIEKNAIEWYRNYDSMEIFFEESGHSEDQKRRRKNKDTYSHITFRTLFRYQTSFDRCIFRALHELQRVQAIREGRVGIVPSAVDVFENP